MGTKNIMENKTTPRRNDMGNEVVDGYACKPKNYDPERPVMHYKSQVLLCDDARCGQAHKNEDKAAHLRAMLKRLHLNQGEDRIKISRTRCLGMCRFRGVAQIVENTRANGTAANNGLWLRATHRYGDEEWEALFGLLRDGRAVEDAWDEGRFIPMRVYGE